MLLLLATVSVGGCCISRFWAIWCCCCCVVGAGVGGAIGRVTVGVVGVFSCGDIVIILIIAEWHFVKLSNPITRAHAAFIVPVLELKRKTQIAHNTDDDTIQSQ